MEGPIDLRGLLRRQESEFIERASQILNQRQSLLLKSFGFREHLADYLVL